MSDVLADIATGLTGGQVKVLDLTHPLSELTPVTKAKPGHGQPPSLVRHEVTRYDERGPEWAINWWELSEHLGTHMDAPIHWITGRDGLDLASITVDRLVGPAVVIDKSAEVAENPDFLLSVEDIEEHEAEHGPLPEGGWLLVHTGWDSRALDRDALLNEDADGFHTPGISPDCARLLAQERPIVGVGVETVGADAGLAGGFDPPFPVHRLMLGAGKHTLSQVANLGEMPTTGALVVVAPLKLVGGTGSPARVIALLPA